jgi:hypothetical protein
MSLYYEPDSLYIKNDGNNGNCWCAKIIDSNEDVCVIFYHFRNFEDIVKLYEEKNYKFVQRIEEEEEKINKNL